MSIEMRSLTLSMANCNISFVFADMCKYNGGSFSVAFVRSGNHMPFVLTEAPVSSCILKENGHKRSRDMSVADGRGVTHLLLGGPLGQHITISHIVNVNVLGELSVMYILGSE